MTAPPAPLSTGPVSAPAPTQPRGPLPGFLLDLLIGTGILLSTSIAAGTVWYFYRGVTLAMQARAAGLPLSPADIAVQVGQPGALAQMLMALVSTALPALVLYFWRRRASAQERVAGRLALRRPATWGWVLTVAVGVFMFSSLASATAEHLGIKPVPTNLPLMEQALAQWPLFLVVFAVLIAPAYEELLFRRVLFGRFLAAGRPWLGIVLSGMAFALLHEVPGVSGNGPAAICQLWLVYGVMGAAFAWVYWRTGTLWASIAAHGLNNATALAALYFFGVQ